VPMVIGHLKPVILIPIGFINALSSEEVEAILVHELAHIRRRDYLVNLLQSFMEIVFFFNPAVIWISQLIKAERENCCDDIAIAQAGDKGSYIQALLSCQEYQHAAPGLSMALATNKSTLLNRVKRIVNNHNQSLNIMEKTLITICMVTAGLFTVAFSAKDAAKQPVANLKQARQHTVTVDPKVTYLFKTNNDKTYKFSKTNTKITGLSINGKKIPDSQVANHRPQIDALLKANESAKKQQAKEDTSLKAGKSKIYDPADFNDGTSMGMREVKNGKPFAVYLFKREGVLYQVFMDRNKVAELYVNGKIAPANDYKSQIDRMLEEYKSLIAPPVPAIAPVPPAPPKVIGMIAPAAHVSPVPAIAGVPEPTVPATPAQPTPLAMINAVPAVAPLAPLGMVNSDGLYTKVTDKLIKEGIIKDKNNFDINITNDDLEVDGVKQPEAIHQQVLKIYGKKLGDKINWHYSNHN
jgi:bla regulator protein BlaR1